MQNFPRVTLLPKKERSLLLFHPWLFSGAIKTTDPGILEGDIVEIYSHDEKYLATGHFHEGSIKVRVFSFEKTTADHSFWKARILKAYELRERLGLVNNPITNIYRLVHAEGDGLPGLIIDIYGSTAVIQTHTLGMHRIKSILVDVLKEIYGSRLLVIFDKSAETMSRQASLIIQDEFLLGEQNDAVVMENGIKFSVNWKEGQKTGFFIDQRENRSLLSKYSQGKNVLNTFAYSGGFSMYALKAGANHVDSVDSSKKCVDWAMQNAELNDVKDNHSFFTADVFDYLKKSEREYNIIILDPPAFAKHISSVDKAIIGYRNLNTEGIKHVTKNGFLFTFSCSQAIDKELFRKIIFQAAAQTKRRVRIVHQLSQGPDHPVSVYHPEGEYLKGLVLFVE